MSESHATPWREQRPGDAWGGTPDGFSMRQPELADGPAMWNLVRESTLDDNSPYLYLMLARYYGETCAVAERGDTLGGFLTAFVPPEQPDTLFVWQVGVSPQARGHGLATRLILSILQREACEEVRYVEATVTPSNEASLALFRGLADKLGTRCRESECFPQHLFPVNGHEAEWLLRIGPFSRKDLAALTHMPE